jgi:hypothetical protein
MLRSIAAVLAGYVILAMSIMLATFVSLPLFTDAAFGDWEAARRQLGRGWLLYEFAYSIPIALAAGYATGMVARSAPQRHAAYLAGLILVATIGSVVWTAGRKLIWQDLLLGLCGAGACLIGGFLRERRLRPL